MVEFGFAVRVGCPPAEAFAYLADPANLPEWQRTAEVTALTPGPIGVGSRFHEVHVVLGRRLESITEVAAYEPPRRFDVRVAAGPVPIDASWTVEPDGHGTRILFRASGRPTGVGRLLSPLLVLAGRRRMKAHHRRLQQALRRRGVTA